MKTRNGFTLIEMMIVLAVLAIIVTVAVPNMNSFLETNRLRGVTSQFFSDVQYARSESIKRNTNISVSVTTDGGTAWCYGLNENSGCDCTITDTSDANACTLSYSGVNVLKVGSTTDYPGVRITSPVGTNMTVATFNSTRGIASSTGSIIFKSVNDSETHVDISVLGKVSTCTPSDDHGVSGYSLC